MYMSAMEELDPVKSLSLSRIDFKLLDRNALLRILRHYGLCPHPDIPNDHLIAAVASQFMTANPSSGDPVQSFIDKYCYSYSETSSSRPRSRIRSGDYRNIPARPGEQVAAKALRTNEDGAWILANVLDYDFNTQTYEVQDEDDNSRVVTLPLCDVRRLEDSGSHLRRFDRVLAVFPDTTSFYRAVVVKNPRPPVHGNSSWEVIVRFDDDEDESGKPPARRVPARFVLRRTSVEDDIEEEEDN